MDTNLSCDILPDKTKDIAIRDDNNDRNDPNLVTHITIDRISGKANNPATDTKQEAQTWKLETSKMALIKGRHTKT